ncbi:hypothetical protein [Sphingomonas sp.]|uniref:hypothetical protein n=1 Tax=Sphingomonas sp. TaxID=28214 RepID=UPI00286CE531|nr:hypothetical protein [Sphingomonas sp.]
MEGDIRYYQRRACEEMRAATRAVTEPARERRLQLVDLYLQRLAEMQAPSPFADRNRARAYGVSGSQSAFAWSATDADPRH